MIGMSSRCHDKRGQRRRRRRAYERASVLDRMVGQVFVKCVERIVVEHMVDLAANVTWTHGSPELDEDARKLEAMGADPGPMMPVLVPEGLVSFVPTPMPEPGPNEFRCGRCKKIFPATATENELEQALRENFPEMAAEDCVLICDGCETALMRDTGFLRAF